MQAYSNPSFSAMKETSFVYQDKRGFFLLSGQKSGKIQQNRASERSIGCSEARFCRFRAKKLVYKALFFASIKEKRKGPGRVDLNLRFKSTLMKTLQISRQSLNDMAALLNTGTISRQ